MAKKLMLSAFVIRPIVYAVDVDASQLEDVNVGEQRIKVDELEHFVAEQWPTLWGELQKQYDAAQNAPEPTPINRATKRAADRAKAKAKPSIAE